MTLPFPQPWANASTDRRAPTTEENANGFACGAADPDLFDHLFYRLQQVNNRFAAQLEYSAAQVGRTWSETDDQALFKILETYSDIISEDRAYTVPGDFADAVEAMIFLSNFRIAENAKVVISIAAGEYSYGTKVIPGHPDGLRIKIMGPALSSGMPTETAFSVSGSSGANIATDRIVNAGMLRTRYASSVRITTTNGAVDVGTGDLTLENILFIGSGASSGVRTQGGRVESANVAVHNYLDNWLCDGAGYIKAPNCSASGAVGSGFNVTYSGVIEAPGSVSSGNGGSGFIASISGTIIAPSATAKGNGDTAGGGFFVSLSGTIQARAAVARNNANSGFQVTADGFIQAVESTSQNNGAYGYSIFNGGRINAVSSVSGANASGDYRAMNFGDMSITGYGGAAVSSPAVNTIGNGNCYIKN